MGFKQWIVRAAHAPAIIAAMLAVAGMDAAAQPVQPGTYTSRCGSCHTNPESPYIIQLNAAGNSTAITHAETAGMTTFVPPLDATTELPVLASYIQSYLVYK